MNPQDVTEWHRNDLEARMARARAAVEAETAEANRISEGAPPAGAPDADVEQWNRFGRWAMFACLWALFILPILLVLSLRG
ncbi:MAG: hypothetical protein AAF390_21580 [Pseudomonadota bacterium]